MIITRKQNLRKQKKGTVSGAAAAKVSIISPSTLAFWPPSPIYLGPCIYSDHRLQAYSYFAQMEWPQIVPHEIMYVSAVCMLQIGEINNNNNTEIYLVKPYFLSDHLV